MTTYWTVSASAMAAMRMIGSAKVEYLADRLDEIVPRGHRAIVFSQFTSFLARIREVLERRGIAVAARIPARSLIDADAQLAS